MMRLFVASWWLQLRLLSRSPFFLGMAVTTPIAYCTVAVLMSGGQATARAVIGAGLMGAWSTTLFGAAEALFMQRFSGTLELLIGAPRSLVAPVLGFAGATVSLGLYSSAASWLWATCVLGVSSEGVDWPSLLAGLALSFVSLTAIGFLLAGVYVVTRKGIEITNVMEYPIWVVCGVLVPAAALWGPLQLVGRLLPLGWSMEVVDAATHGGDALQAAGPAVLLSAGYLAAGVVLLKRIDLLARTRGTLRLR
ncbi:ABC transporter permease [Leifsonia sp. F6_8S_P_1B]|uniref:ABC transporter permease n=1 Tax=Leifsonia williamsii TaxID=3035919 RepID=A0ABT8K793_9MICO|nr:ABC transporter permease [Leifsonia williamsii]MDN4613017.1 ABC transporter permease [Leifsonia williamsii]